MFLYVNTLKQDCMNSKQVTTVDIKSPEYPMQCMALQNPPELLHITGAPLQDWIHLPKVGIVGSRKVSAYGRTVTQRLASELAGQGILIISGLALGVDSIAHAAALDAGGRTVAVLPGPVETIYPRSHDQLGKRIAAHGGSLVSEYPDGTPAMKHNFIERNRIIAALSDVLLITEAAEASGSLHTARFANELNKIVAAVPGNITSPTSMGSNALLKNGAATITCAADVLALLNLTDKTMQVIQQGSNDAEQCILDLLASGIVDGDELHIKSELPIQLFNQAIAMLEITGKIRSLGSNQWSLH